MSNKRREVLDRLSSEERLLVASAWDKAERASKHWQTEYTAFLQPADARLLTEHQYLWQTDLAFFGGYEGAERVIMAFSPAGHEPVEADYPLRAVTVEGSFQFSKPGHRDYMGSLLALGLKREFFGDILVSDAGAQVIMHQTVIDYVLVNWQEVGRAKVKVRELPIAEVVPPEREMEVRTGTVATLRLDAVLATCYGLSRSKAADLIRAGRVKLNHKPESRTDRLVDEGAILSLAGYGRGELQEVGGESRKGRIYIRTARWK